MAKKEVVADNVTDTKFCVEALRASCTELFNVSSATFDGAMSTHSGERLTVDEAQKLVNEFLNKRIGGK